MNDGIAQDIESVKQYLNLASRTMNRTISACSVEMLSAKPDEHRDLLRLQDQCRAVVGLIDHAHDAHQGIDIDFLTEADGREN